MNHREGFAIGAIAAITTRLGVVTILPEAALLLFLLGLTIEVYRVFRKKSTINPPADGAVSGFCWIHALFSALRF